MRGADESVLLVDLYQLTMLLGYRAERMGEHAAFELFVRKLGPNRNFLVAAGLEPALSFLEHASFDEDELRWLRESKGFAEDFVDWLSEWRFRGDVDALPEGTIFFADEPLLRVTAPIHEAQLVESRVLNLLHLHTLLASKAVRCRLVAPGKQLVDFGLRRAHGAEAGVAAARSSYVAGFAGTSTVLAGTLFGIPTYGTMAHSYIEAHDDESAAFEGFARARRSGVVLLIDTYDTQRGAEKVVELAPKLLRDGIAIAGVRIDSGDLVKHAFEVRSILDKGGLGEVGIFASGSLDEYSLQDFISRGAPIDGFGVGTKMDVSADAPYLDSADKLTEYAGKGRRKHSEKKETWPGKKQVHRRYDSAGRMVEDVLALVSEAIDGEPLLRPVMRGGRRVQDPEPLEEARRRLDEQIERLPGPLRRLEKAPDYPVRITHGLRESASEVDRRLEDPRAGGAAPPVA